jgi:hypothetical protein
MISDPCYFGDAEYKRDTVSVSEHSNQENRPHLDVNEKMRLQLLITPLLICACAQWTHASETSWEDDLIATRIRQVKLDLWLHGAFSFSPDTDDVDASAIATDLEMQAVKAPVRLGPIREVRRRLKRDLQLGGRDSTDGWHDLMDKMLSVRGGDEAVGGEYASRLEKQMADLSAKFGKPFVDAIEKVIIALLC